MGSAHSSWDGTAMTSQEGKIAVVTGGASGLGFATALALACQGAHVVIADRDAKRGPVAQQEICDKTANANVDFIALDLGSLDQIRAFVDAIKSKFDRLDLLINNAGVLNPDHVTHTTDGYEVHFGVNHLGHFYLTSLLFELLKRSTESRIVCVTSMTHRSATANFETIGLDSTNTTLAMLNDYGASKLSNIVFVHELHRRLQAAKIDNVKVLACHPGMAFTNMSAIKKYVPILPEFAQAWMDKLTSYNPFLQPPERASLPTLCAATLETAKSGEFYGPDGWGACWGNATLEQPSPASLSEEEGRKLWKRSEELLKVIFPLPSPTTAPIA